MTCSFAKINSGMKIKIGCAGDFTFLITRVVTNDQGIRGGKLIM